MFDFPVPIASKPHPPGVVAQWCRELAADLSPAGFLVRTLKRMNALNEGFLQDQIQDLHTLWEHARIAAPDRAIPNLLEGSVQPERAVNWLNDLARWILSEAEIVRPHAAPHPVMNGEADAKTIARENGVDVNDRKTLNRVKVWFTNYAKKHPLCYREASESGPVRKFYRRADVVLPFRASFLTGK